MSEINPKDLLKRKNTDEILLRKKNEDIKSLENLLKKQKLNEYKIEKYEEELKLLKSDSVLSNEEINNIVHNYLLSENQEKEENQVINELLKLENNIRDIDPHLATIFMNHVVYSKYNHIINNDIREKYLQKREEIKKEKKNQIMINVDNLSKMCNYDFKELLLITGFNR